MKKGQNIGTKSAFTPTSISHITQSDKDKNFDKTKDLVNWSHKKVTYDLPKTSFHS